MEIDREAKEVFMTFKEFKDLPEYSVTIPTGTTPGKIWKARIPYHDGGDWFLREFEAYPEGHPDHDTHMKINTFTISIVQAHKEESARVPSSIR